ANTSAGSLQWSPDGKFLLFETNQRTETPQVARIDLTPRQPKFAEDRFEELFKPEAPRQGGRGAAADAKPSVQSAEIEFKGSSERSSLLPIGLAVNNPQISPDGRSLLVSATVAGQSNLYLYPLDEPTDGAAATGGGRGGRGGAGNRVARQLT